MKRNEPTWKKCLAHRRSHDPATKGGVGKYNALIGQLLLQDFTVAKVMLGAIMVGMIGIFTMHHFGLVNLHLKPNRIGAKVIGGLLFGAGFALLGYCPRTVAVALAREAGCTFRNAGTGRRFMGLRGTIGVEQAGSRKMGRHGRNHAPRLRISCAAPQQEEDEENGNRYPNQPKQSPADRTFRIFYFLWNFHDLSRLNVATDLKECVKSCNFDHEVGIAYRASMSQTMRFIPTA